MWNWACTECTVDEESCQKYQEEAENDLKLNSSGEKQNNLLDAKEKSAWSQ